MEVLYVLPVVYMGRGGKVAIEHRTQKRKLDRRTRFYKRNKNYIVKDVEAFDKLLNDTNFNVKRKDNRIILPNGKTAFGFGKALDKLIGE